MTKFKGISDVPPTLEEAQKFVGGYIEIIILKNGDQLIIDEEGKLKEKEINWPATGVFQDNFGYHDIIVGDAMWLKGKGRMK